MIPFQFDHDFRRWVSAIVNPKLSLSLSRKFEIQIGTTLFETKPTKMSDRLRFSTVSTPCPPLPLHYNVGVKHHRHRLCRLSTQTQMIESSTDSGSINNNSDTSVTTTKDDESDDNDDDDDDHDDDIGSSDTGTDPDNDDKATTRNIDDYFGNVNLDDNDDSLELPPNPDIPAPKVRTPYPVVAPPTSGYVRSNRKVRRTNDASSVLANEKLVAKIMQNMKHRKIKSQNGSNNQSHRKHDEKSANDIQVRVLPDPLVSKTNRITTPTKDVAPETKIDHNITHDDDKNDDENNNDNNNNRNTVETVAKNESKGKNNKPKAIVMTLSEAIQMSIEQQKDLVEVSIDQEVPVVTISNWKGIAYQSAKTKKSNKGANAASTQVKEVTMHAGIATNDLQRKVNDVFKFLEKGHMCIVSIRISRKQNRENSNAAKDAVQRILPLLPEDKVEMVVPPEINPLQTMASFRVRGKKEITGGKKK
jgi:translation initiation factor IF-3